METNETASNINYIKNKVNTIEKIELLNLRSNNILKEEYKSLFKRDNIAFKIYKSIDGIKSQKQIAELLEVSTASVCNKISILSEKGLIEIKRVTSSGEKIYTHTIAEIAFKLSKEE